jgi:hypothetical protein
MFVLIMVAMLTVASTHRPAQAADVKDVLKACDRTPGCSYKLTNKDITGCSKYACFYCPADGSRQCIGITKSEAGPVSHRVTIGGVVIGAASSPSQMPPKGAGGPRHLDLGPMRPLATAPVAKHPTSKPTFTPLKVQPKLNRASPK